MQLNSHASDQNLKTYLLQPDKLEVKDGFIVASFSRRQRYEVRKALVVNNLLSDFTNPYPEKGEEDFIREFSKRWGLLWASGSDQLVKHFPMEWFQKWRSFFILLCRLTNVFQKQDKQRTQEVLEEFLKAKAEVDLFFYPNLDVKTDDFFEGFSKEDQGRALNKQIPISYFLLWKDWPKEPLALVACVIANEFGHVTHTFQPLKTDHGWQICKCPLVFDLRHLLLWQLSEQHTKLEFRICRYCGKDFLVNRKDKLYCRGSCRASEGKRQDRLRGKKNKASMSKKLR